MKEFDKFSKILGRAITSENISAVTAEEWEKVNAHSDAPTPAAATPPTPAPTAEEKPETPATAAPLTAEAVQGIVTTALNPISERLSKLEKAPAAGTTPTPIVAGGESATKHSWENPDKDPFLALAMKELGMS